MFSSFLKNVVNTVAPEAMASQAPSHGFRILRLTEPSPAASSGLESFYDFILNVDGVGLTNDAAWLKSYFTSASSTIVLQVWSVKGQVTREVRVPPPSLTNMPLGVALRWCPTQPTIENVYHVLDVAPNSPAARAGLQAHEDFIVGTPQGIVRGESGMAELVDDHLNQVLKLYIFNIYHNSTREASIIPDRSWGGPGSLGCGIGFGVLHRLPQGLISGPPAPEGQTIFDTAEHAEDLITGAQISEAAAVASQPKKTKKKHRMAAAEVDALLEDASLDST